MSDIQSRPYRPAPNQSCEACCFGRTVDTKYRGGELYAEAS